jgi:hypothetical protein
MLIFGMIEYLLLGIAKFMSASDRNAGSISSHVTTLGRLPERFYSLIRASEWLPYWLTHDPLSAKAGSDPTPSWSGASRPRRHRAHVVRSAEVGRFSKADIVSAGWFRP